MAYAFDLDDEISPPPPTRAEVEADIAEWRARLNLIMQQIAAWLKDHPILVCMATDVAILEPRLEFVGIKEAMQLPGLALFVAERLQKGTESPDAQILPDARWVIGTRGQFRIWMPGKVYTIADLGEPGRPEWRLTMADDLTLPPFTRPMLMKMLDSLA